MEKAKKLNLIGQLLLLTATVVWGTSFFILKNTIEQVPAYFVIAIRFLFSGVVLFFIFIKKLKKLDKKTLLQGIIIGVFVAAAYMLQTSGLKHTSPGRNAFLTSTYCVMCPFIVWVLFKKKPKAYNLISAVICLVGIGLISLSGESGGEESSLLGEVLTVLSAIFFALQIIYARIFQKNGADSIILLIFEFLTVGVILMLSSFVLELPKCGIKGYAINLEQGLNIAYLAVTCTLFAQSAQMIGQKFTTTSQSALILSLESVFGMFFSVLFGAEKLSPILGVGFAVVFIAVLINELELDPFKGLKKHATATCERENINNEKKN